MAAAPVAAAGRRTRRVRGRHGARRAVAAPRTGGAPLRVDGAFLPQPVDTGLAAGFLTVHNTGGGDTLTSVTSDLAARVTLHRTPKAAMEMQDSFPVPAHGSLAFARGGNHLMFEQLTHKPKVGDTVAVPLHFSGRARQRQGPGAVPPHTTRAPGLVRAAPRTVPTAPKAPHHREELTVHTLPLRSGPGRRLLYTVVPACSPVRPCCSAPGTRRRARRAHRQRPPAGRGGPGSAGAGVADLLRGGQP